MTDHEHDYRKLNDDAVFCRGCGDIKSAAPAVCTLPHYPTYDPWMVRWYPVTPWWTVTSGSTGDTPTITYDAGAVS